MSNYKEGSITYLIILSSPLGGVKYYPANTEDKDGVDGILLSFLQQACKDSVGVMPIKCVWCISK